MEPLFYFWTSSLRGRIKNGRISNYLYQICLTNFTLFYWLKPSPRPAKTSTLFIRQQALALFLQLEAVCSLILRSYLIYDVNNTGFYWFYGFSSINNIYYVCVLGETVYLTIVHKLTQIQVLRCGHL